MNTIMERSVHDSSFSFSRRYFTWRKNPTHDYYNHDDDYYKYFDHNDVHLKTCGNITTTKTKHSTISKLRSFFTKNKAHNHNNNVNSNVLGSKVVIGTLFGYRRGNVHIAFQEDPKSNPAFLIELAAPTSVLVKEMTSGLVRVALECDKKVVEKIKLGFYSRKVLLEEPIWRAYCNGKKYGYAMRRDCGPNEWEFLNSIGPITMGAGVFKIPGPSNGGCGGGSDRVGLKGEIMYMRAKFERVVGSKDSEAFYMLNPEKSGTPELSVYLLRV